MSIPLPEWERLSRLPGGTNSITRPVSRADSSCADADGILVTLAMKERKTRIELGKGMQRYINDATPKGNYQRVVVPAFRTGNDAVRLERALDQLMHDARDFVINANELPKGDEVQR
jgi:uncharacterized membrane protein YgcG